METVSSNGIKQIIRAACVLINNQSLILNLLSTLNLGTLSPSTLALVLS